MAVYGKISANKVDVAETCNDLNNTGEPECVTTIFKMFKIIGIR